MKLCLLLCLIVCIDCRSFGLSWLRRYGGPNPRLYRPSTSLHAPRPGTYAHQWPLHGGSKFHYPVRPHTLAYQQPGVPGPPPLPPGALQKTKMLNIMLDHSGHVDADSLFPAAQHIPTVLIPPNSPALAPPMVVGYGLYDKRPAQGTPPHAHFSMLHPSYETSYTQHHHNEISYFDNPPPPQNYKYPMPYPVKNYVTSSSYSSVAIHGQNNNHGHSNQLVRPSHLLPPPTPPKYPPPPQHPPPPQYPPPQHQQPSATYLPGPSPSVPVPSASHHPVPQLSLPYPPPPPSYSGGNTAYEVSYLHPTPAHFSHNNPLGTLPCCDDVPWSPLGSVPVSPPLFREHRLHPTTRHPMMAYLPIKGHHVESESQPFISVVTISNGITASNATSGGHWSNDTITEAALVATTTVASKNNTELKSTPTAILMLSTPKMSTTTSVPPASTTKSSLPKLRNSTSLLGAFLASITETPGIDTFDVKPAVNLSQADVQEDSATAAAPTQPSSGGVTSSPAPPPPTTTRAPPIRARPVRPTQSDDIFGFPDDILPSEGNAGEAAADSGGEGGGMVDIFTSFLDELANIIEQFSPTDLPGVANEVGGAASDAVGETANAAGEAAGDVGGAAGDLGGALGEAGGANLGGLTDTAGGVAGGFGEGLGGVAEGAVGVPEGIGGGVAPAGNEISASSQISSNTANSIFNSPLRLQPQSAFAFEGMPFGPQFGANFNNFEAGESAEAEGGGFFDESLSAVSHAESEPVAEASMGIQDHFIEIPISELVPHPSFLRNNIAVNPFSEAEPHPVVTNLGRPKDFEVDHFDSQESGSDGDQIASATESNYQVGQLPLDSEEEQKKPSNYDVDEDDTEGSFSTVQPVSNHIEVTTTLAPESPSTKKSNAIPWPKVDPNRNHYLDSLLSKAAEHVPTETPEIISFSSTVSHWPQYGTRVPNGARSNEKIDKDNVVQKEVEVLSTTVIQDKMSKEDDEIREKKEPKALVAEPTPKTDIKIKSELGAIRNTNNLSSLGHTEKSIALPEISTIRDYHSRNTDEEKDNVPDAEGIPANILPEVESNINLDLLRTEYNG